MNKNIKISKLDAAKRQLETAIRLYFNEADPVSIHTLVGSAHQILTDLNKKRGGGPMILSDHLVRKEYKKEFIRCIFEARNYFKHANRDPDGVIDFNSDANDFFLYDACEKYQELTGENIFIVFRAWFIAQHIGMFNLTSDEKNKILLIAQKHKNKTEYFSKMLSIS